MNQQQQLWRQVGLASRPSTAIRCAKLSSINSLQFDRTDPHKDPTSTLMQSGKNAINALKKGDEAGLVDATSFARECQGGTISKTVSAALCSLQIQVRGWFNSIFVCVAFWLLLLIGRWLLAVTTRSAQRPSMPQR